MWADREIKPRGGRAGLTVIGAGGGFAYGYKRGGLENALFYGGLGNGAGDLLSVRFIKCHIAGTPVHVPLDDAPPEAEQLVAAGPPLADGRSQFGDGWWRNPVGVGLLAAGAAGLAAGQSYRRRRRCEEQARDYACSVDSAISQQDSWLDSLADELCGLLAGRGGSRQPHARPNFVSAGPIH